jgi:hypothetical protein
MSELIPVKSKRKVANLMQFQGWNKIIGWLCFINVNETYPTYNGYPSTSSSSTSHQIFFLPFSAGLIIPVANNLGVQIEGGYSVGWNISSGNHDETLNAFTIGIGICGLGQKMAVSIVNFFNLLTSIY